MATNFLSQVKAISPRAYRWLWVLIILIGGVTIVRIESPPFYVWSMYAAPIAQQDTFEVFVCSYDGKIFNEPRIWNHHRRILFNYSIEYYYQSKKHGMQAADGIKIRAAFGNKHPIIQQYLDQVYSSSATISEYPQWLKHYMSSLIGEAIHELIVYRYEVCYQADGSIEVIGREIVCQA